MRILPSAARCALGLLWSTGAIAIAVAMACVVGMIAAFNQPRSRHAYLLRRVTEYVPQRCAVLPSWDVLLVGARGKEICLCSSIRPCTLAFESVRLTRSPIQGVIPCEEV